MASFQATVAAGYLPVEGQAALLIEIAPKLAVSVATGGALILSGILRTQEAEVLAAFRRAGFRMLRSVRKGKWVALMAKRAAR